MLDFSRLAIAAAALASFCWVATIVVMLRDFYSTVVPQAAACYQKYGDTLPQPASAYVRVISSTSGYLLVAWFFAAGAGAAAKRRRARYTVGVLLIVAAIAQVLAAWSIHIIAAGHARCMIRLLS